MGTITRLFCCTRGTLWALFSFNLWGIYILFFFCLMSIYIYEFFFITVVSHRTGNWIWEVAGYWLGLLLLLHWRRALDAFIFGSKRFCCLCWRWRRRQREIPKWKKRDMASETPKGCLEVVAAVGVGQPTEPRAPTTRIPSRRLSNLKLLFRAFSRFWNLGGPRAKYSTTNWGTFWSLKAFHWRYIFKNTYKQQDN